MKHDVRLRPLLTSGEPQLYARAIDDAAHDVVLLALSGTDPQSYPRIIQPPPFIESIDPPEPPGDPVVQSLRLPATPSSLAVSQGPLTEPAARSPLLLKDPLGLLPANPAQWPEELKQAIAKCCCGDEGSSSSSSDSGGGVTASCCPGTELPGTLCLTISGGTLYDGTFTLTYSDASPYPVSLPVPGWYSAIQPVPCDDGGIAYATDFFFLFDSGSCSISLYTRLAPATTYTKDDNRTFRDIGTVCYSYDLTCDPFLLLASNCAYPSVICGPPYLTVTGFATLSPC